MSKRLIFTLMVVAFLAAPAKAAFDLIVALMKEKGVGLSDDCKMAQRYSQREGDLYLAAEPVVKKLLQSSYQATNQEKEAVRKLWEDYYRVNLSCKENQSTAFDKSSIELQRMEIRDDFYNGLFGPLGKTNEERGNMRMAMAKIMAGL